MLPWLTPLLLFALFAALLPDYLARSSLEQLLRDFAEPGLIALAMAVVVLSGGIDLSLGASFALTNLAALYLFQVQKLPLALAALGAGATGLALGSLNGLLIGYVGARPFLTTLASLLILRAAYDGLSLSLSADLAAARDSTGWAFLGAGSVLGAPLNFVMLIGAGVAVQVFLSRIRPGIHLLAVGAEPRAAGYAGVDLRATRWLAHALAGGLAGLAGLLYAAQQNNAGSDVGVGWEVTALTAVVAGGIRLSGGRGTVAGALAGAASVFLLGNGLLRLNVAGSAASAIIGLALLVIVAPGSLAVLRALR